MAFSHFCKRLAAAAGAVGLVVVATAFVASATAAAGFAGLAAGSAIGAAAGPVTAAAIGAILGTSGGSIALSASYGLANDYLGPTIKRLVEYAKTGDWPRNLEEPLLNRRPSRT